MYRTLEWEAFPFSRGSSQPRHQTQVSCIAGGFFYQLTHKGSPLCTRRSMSIGIYHYIYVYTHAHTHTHTYIYMRYMMGTLASSNHIICLYLEYFVVFLLKSFIRWAIFWIRTNDWCRHLEKFSSLLLLFSPSVMSDSFATPMDCSPPGSSAHGILQARILEWVAISSFRGCFQPRDQIHVSCLGFFNTDPPGKPLRNSLIKYKNRQVYILLTLEAFMWYLESNRVSNNNLYKILFN